MAYWSRQQARKEIIRWYCLILLPVHNLWCGLYDGEILILRFHWNRFFTASFDKFRPFSSIRRSWPSIFGWWYCQLQRLPIRIRMRSLSGMTIIATVCQKCAFRILFNRCFLISLLSVISFASVDSESRLAHPFQPTSYGGLMSGLFIKCLFHNLFNVHPVSGSAPWMAFAMRQSCRANQSTQSQSAIHIADNLQWRSFGAFKS